MRVSSLVQIPSLFDTWYDRSVPHHFSNKHVIWATFSRSWKPSWRVWQCLSKARWKTWHRLELRPDIISHYRTHNILPPTHATGAMMHHHIVYIRPGVMKERLYHHHTRIAPEACSWDHLHYHLTTAISWGRYWSSLSFSALFVVVIARGCVIGCCGHCCLLWRWVYLHSGWRNSLTAVSIVCRNSRGGGRKGR
jgi:hypothetical protein